MKNSVRPGDFKLNELIEAVYIGYKDFDYSDSMKRIYMFSSLDCEIWETGLMKRISFKKGKKYKILFGHKKGEYKNCLPYPVRIEGNGDIYAIRDGKGIVKIERNGKEVPTSPIAFMKYLMKNRCQKMPMP